MDTRLADLKTWLHSQITPNTGIDVRPLSGDASFRRYFRVHQGTQTWVAMDAPPAKEDCHPFCAIAGQWHSCGICVPEIVAEDLDQGFLLLSDHGDDLLLGLLNHNNADTLYRQAIDELMLIQHCPTPREYPLPAYNQALLAREMELFRDWLVGRKLEIALTGAEHRLLDDSFSLLIDNATQQPQVVVHRDYHSRNLLLDREQRIAVLDFQDAVIGPITYDLVSLLRDCYIQWPVSQVRGWAQYFLQQARTAGLHEVDDNLFMRWFDLMGVQRHLKASGIFARLDIRDGKQGYLKDIPRTLGYIDQVLGCYPELEAFHHWLQERVLPVVTHKLGAIPRSPV